MHIEEKQLKDFLIDAGLVSEKDILIAGKKAKSKKVSLGETLVSEGLLANDDLKRSEAYVLGIPFIGSGFSLPFRYSALR